MTLTLWTLIAIQIAMASFDTIYHHELTERLAWRPSQRHELTLHAARSLIYAALFLVLGFLEPHGVLAMLVIAALAVEVFVTLADFIEEDMSRKLSASERVNHTLLAINYGAILVLAAPILLAWAREPAAIKLVSHGYWSALMVFAAAGAAIFGLRDLAASRRPAAAVTPPEDLVTALPPRQTVLVTGATGFIGRRLVQALTAAGHHVIVLARDPAKAATLNPPFRLITGLSQLPDDTPIDAIVNLAGEPVANGLWTVGKRHRILATRLRMTGNVVRLIKRLQRKPAVLISASAIGWYGARGDELLTEAESGRPSFGFSVCGDWERAAVQAERFGVRVVRLRIGLVLGAEGGMLAQMLIPFEYGFGGHRFGPAMDGLDRARRHGAADRRRDGQSGLHRTGQRDRARAGAQRDIHAGARTRLASPGLAAPAGRAAALARWRHGRGAAAHRPARRAGQGAESRLRVPPREPARRADRDPRWCERARSDAACAAAPSGAGCQKVRRFASRDGAEGRPLTSSGLTPPGRSFHMPQPTGSPVNGGEG